ncbi:MAG: ATP:cob(I)alamin adenosyltransferase [Actinobacteria bacterium]|nr:ATP:cob(I)alamin adenosyltransferase [Actinomycetota bacterium]|tara:strand:+ start:4242 stop:4808 length:567 start_codon:yes stop_codon:yes gene_type:complete
MVNGMKIYTRNGDDGTTGLFYGGRVRKDSDHPSAYGDVDEAQAAIGHARSQVERGSEIDSILVHVLRDLWVLMAELATLPENRDKLEDGVSLVTNTMVEDLEKYIDRTSDKFSAPTEFVIPGQNQTAAALDIARTVVRRAERSTLKIQIDGSFVGPYLNRLSDLMWMLARWQDQGSLSAREIEINKEV